MQFPRDYLYVKERHLAAIPIYATQNGTMSNPFIHNQFTQAKPSATKAH